MTRLLVSVHSIMGCIKHIPVIWKEEVEYKGVLYTVLEATLYIQCILGDTHTVVRRYCKGENDEWMDT